MGMRREITLRLKYEEGCRHYFYKCDIYKELHPVVPKSTSEKNLDLANETQAVALSDAGHYTQLCLINNPF